MKFCVKLEYSSMETILMIFKATAMGTADWQLHHDYAPAHASRVMQRVLVKHQITQVTQPPTAHVWCPLTSKVKSPLKRERFQTADEIRENMMGQLRAIGRTV